jgi:inorganic pyrophosphatase
VSSKPDCTRDFAFGNAEIEIARLRSAAQSGARDAVSRVALWSVTTGNPRGRHPAPARERGISIAMTRCMRSALLLVLLPVAVAAQVTGTTPASLPAAATAQLAKSLEAATPQATHLWRDTPPINPDGTVNGYIEIPRGERNKFEFDMKVNARRVDRVMPEQLGGYPVNYGFVPQSVSYDGDPFDILVLGPPLPGGEFVTGAIVGVMFMEDEKGPDSKVVVSPLDRTGQPRYPLTAAVMKRIGDYFARYKKHEPGKFSKVFGWGSAAEGLAYVRTTHAFFEHCPTVVGQCS